MKFSTINGLPFEDPAWIAGVDNNDDIDDKSKSKRKDTDSNSNYDTETDYKSNEELNDDDKTV